MLYRYIFSIDEYNMALMWLFSFKSILKPSGNVMILKTTGLGRREEDGSLETWIYYYKNVKNSFHHL